MPTLLETYIGKTSREAVFARSSLDLPFLTPFINSLPKKILRIVENKLIGVEIEIEKAYPGLYSPYWTVEKDGSLRNEGLEYKTLYPTKVGTLWTSLTAWKDWIDGIRLEIPDAYDSSERTSIHVHVDVRMMEEEDIQKLVAIYVFLEDTLFNYCGPNRKHNVFCTPINSLPLVDWSPQDLIKAWNKYSALNLNTIRTFGTVEFRGMAGTDNIHHIMTWTVMCALLVAAAETTEKKTLWEMFKEIKTTSDYKRAISTFLYGFTELLHWDDVLVDDAVTNARIILAKGIA